MGIKEVPDFITKHPGLTTAALMALAIVTAPKDAASSQTQSKVNPIPEIQALVEPQEPKHGYPLELVMEDPLSIYARNAQRLLSEPIKPTNLTFSEAMANLGYKVSDLNVFKDGLVKEGKAGNEGLFLRTIPAADARIVPELDIDSLGAGRVLAGATVKWIGEIDAIDQSGNIQRFGLIIPGSLEKPLFVSLAEKKPDRNWTENVTGATIK